MILNQQQIEEIESSLDDGIYVFTGFNKSLTQNLLETVKALRQENEAQRELLEKAFTRLRHDDDCPYEYDETECLCETAQIEDRIEEYLK